MPSRRIKSTKFGSVKIMDSLSAFDDLYTAIEACLIYPDEVIDRLARAFYPAILACWNSEEGQREFAAWQAEQAHHIPSKEKQSVSDGERPVVHIAVVCRFNRKFYKQCNSQQLVCDMQFTVVANESNRELRWQGASYSGAHPVFVLYLIF